MVPVPRKPTDRQIETWSTRRKAVGARIRELRLEREFTQEQLGNAAGLDRRSLLYLELGQRGLAFERLWDIADALGVEVTELLTQPESMPQRIVYRGGRRRHRDRNIDHEHPRPAPEGNTDDSSPLRDFGD